MADETTAPDPTTPEPELSLAEHEAQFSRDGAVRQTSVEPAAETTPADSPTTDDGSAAATPRDDKGRFQPKGRQRARSQQAGPEDVPRIQELTRKLREAEEERDRLKASGSATVAPPDSSARGAAQLPDRPARVEPPTARAKPTPDAKHPDGSPKYATYEDYLDDRDAFNREQWQAESRKEQAAREEQTRLATSWQARIATAKTKYDDFDQVALDTPTKIPAGGIVDAWILEDDDGAEILYHLQKNPAELESLLKLGPFQQVKTLSLLGQRLTGSSTRTQATSTGAVARPPVVVPPRPPTPVRTGPVRAADEPPDDETASLDEHEKFYGRSRLRR